MSEGVSTSLSVCVRDHVACVRVTGQAKFTAATDFKNLLIQLQQDGCTEVILDLTSCSLMDSTFLGVMTGVARRSEAALQAGKLFTLALFHPTERVLEALENLDVLRMFTVLTDPPQFNSFTRVGDSNTTRVEMTRTCFEAHETLMNTCPENERRFRDATEFFRKNMKEDEGKK